MQYRFAVGFLATFVCLPTAAVLADVPLSNQQEQDSTDPQYPILIWPVERPFYIDRRGKVVLRPAVTSAGRFSEGLALAADNLGIYGYINCTGTFAIKPQFGSGYAFSEGLAAIAVAGRWGYIDAKGTLVIRPQFTDVRPFREGLARVNVGGRIDMRYGPNPNDLPRYGFIDKRGKWAIKPNLAMNSASDFSDGLSRVTTDTLDGYLDKTGKFALDASQYRYAGAFSEGVANVVGQDNKCRYIDKTGKVVIEARCDWPHPFSEGLARVVVNKETTCRFSGQKTTNSFGGYIDRTGRIVIQPRFAGGNNFHDGLAAVRIDFGLPHADSQKWGYVNHRGKLTIPARFNAAHDFQRGVAWVHLGGNLEEFDVHQPPQWTGGEWRLIDTKGNTIWSSVN